MICDMLTRVNHVSYRSLLLWREWALNIWNIHSRSPKEVLYVLRKESLQVDLGHH